MKHWLLLLLFGFSSLNSFAQAVDSVQIGCNRLSLVLPHGVSSRVVDRDWASGKQHSEASAVLELRSSNGKLLDKLTLDAPLARLDPNSLRGAPAPTHLISVDLTQPAGSYNGPLTFPVQIVNNHLQRVVALTSDRHLAPINLAMTGKAAWKRIFIKGTDSFLSVSCQRQDRMFVTFYRRYYPTRSGWRVRSRSTPGFWESDCEFPDIKQFP
jgi:hypothetical protein